MSPSDFMNKPYDSVLKHSESETVARNIMVILARTGDTFRPLDWTEYKQERQKDGSFTESEKEEFDKVIQYCKSEDTAQLFSTAWRKVPA